MLLIKYKYGRIFIDGSFSYSLGENNIDICIKLNENYYLISVKDRHKAIEILDIAMKFYNKESIIEIDLDKDEPVTFLRKLKLKYLK